MGIAAVFAPLHAPRVRTATAAVRLARIVTSEADEVGDLAQSNYGP
jgi:hypothetical protein